MNLTAIRVENLSKQYEIGVQQTRHNTLRDRLADGVKSLVRRKGAPPSHVRSRRWKTSPSRSSVAKSPASSVAMGPARARC